MTLALFFRSLFFRAASWCQNQGSLVQNQCLRRNKVNWVEFSKQIRRIFNYLKNKYLQLVNSTLFVLKTQSCSSAQRFKCKLEKDSVSFFLLNSLAKVQVTRKTLVQQFHEIRHLNCTRLRTGNDCIDFNTPIEVGM